MTSYGSLINENSITGNGYVTQIVSAGEMKNTGTIATKNVAIINSLGNLNNGGIISNTPQMSVTAAGNLSNAGTIHATNLLSVTTNGNLNTTYNSSLNSSNQLTVTALGNIDNGGIQGHGATMNINNTVTSNSWHIKGDTLSLNTYLDMVNTGTLETKGDLTINTQNNGKLTNEGTIKAGNTLTLSAKQVVNAKSYKCGFLNLKTCTNNGTLTANKRILNSSHKYASNMGGNQNFKATEINTK